MDSRRYGSSVDLHDRDRDDDDPIVRLTEENVKLRRKLKELNYRLDDELEKAAKDRFKTPKIETKHADNSGNELKNAYRIIDRLQKSIKHYESNEGYNSSMTKIMDLEDVIKKKEKEIEELRVELKTQKKINKEQEKHIDELNEASKKVVNPAQDKEQIRNLKEKVRKLSTENQQLQRANREKHKKMVGLDIKARELERELEEERPVPEKIQQQDIKVKYKDSVDKLAKQSALLIKYKDRISELQDIIKGMRDFQTKRQTRQKLQTSLRQNHRSSTQKVHTSQRPTNSLSQHIPSQVLPKRIRNQRGIFS